MKRYQLGVHTKHDLKVTPGVDTEVPEEGLMAEVALRVRDLIRQIAMGHELTILSRNVARDHIHVFLAYRPHVDVSMIND